MLGIVRIRPLWLLTVGLYRAGGYEPPLQLGRKAVRIRPTRLLAMGLYRAGEPPLRNIPTNYNWPRKACTRNINISRCFANDTQGGNGRKLVYSSEILKILEIFLKMLCN